MFHPVCSRPWWILPQHPEVSQVGPELSLGVSPIVGCGVERVGAALAAQWPALPVIDRRYRCPQPWPLRSSRRGPGGRGVACWRVVAHAAGRLRRGGRWRSGFGAQGTQLPARVIGAGAQAAATRRREACAAKTRPSRKALQSKGIAIRCGAQLPRHPVRKRPSHLGDPCLSQRGPFAANSPCMLESPQCTARTLRIAALCASERTARRRVLAARAQATRSPDGGSSSPAAARPQATRQAQRAAPVTGLERPRWPKVHSVVALRAIRMRLSVAPS